MALAARYQWHEAEFTAIERAFELARTGRYVHLAEIRANLREEGNSDHLIVGSYLAAQLRQLMREANPRLSGFNIR